MHPEEIAVVCHQANRTLRQMNGQPPGPEWWGAPADMHRSTFNGVYAAIAAATPEQLHNSWLNKRMAAGWKYGEVRDEQAKTHPCLVKYDELPEANKRKDALFHAIVNALRDPHSESKPDLSYAVVQLADGTERFVVGAVRAVSSEMATLGGLVLSLFDGNNRELATFTAGSWRHYVLHGLPPVHDDSIKHNDEGSEQ